MVEISKLTVLPAYQAVSRELQALIVGGQLSPGDQLPSETDLAERFGVNRSTVREGIRQLESEGLLRREGRKRLLIAVPGQDSLSPRMERALVMNDVTFRELWQVAMALEPLVATLAAQHATDDQISALNANAAAMEAGINAGRNIGELDTEFHSLMAECSGNRALLLSREPVGQLLFRAYIGLGESVSQAPARNLAAHRSIIAAVAARDADGAASWMRRHIEDLRRGWLLAGRSVDDRIEPR